MIFGDYLIRLFGKDRGDLLQVKLKPRSSSDTRCSLPHGIQREFKAFSKQSLMPTTLEDLKELLKKIPDFLQKRPDSLLHAVSMVDYTLSIATFDKTTENDLKRYRNDHVNYLQMLHIILAAARAERPFVDDARVRQVLRTCIDEALRNNIDPLFGLAILYYLTCIDDETLRDLGITESRQKYITDIARSLPTKVGKAGDFAELYQTEIALIYAECYRLSMSHASTPNEFDVEAHTRKNFDFILKISALRKLILGLNPGKADIFSQARDGEPITIGDPEENVDVLDVEEIQTIEFADKYSDHATLYQSYSVGNDYWDRFLNGLYQSTDSPAVLMKAAQGDIPELAWEEALQCFYDNSENVLSAEYVRAVKSELQSTDLSDVEDEESTSAPQTLEDVTCDLSMIHREAETGSVEEAASDDEGNQDHVRQLNPEFESEAISSELVSDFSSMLDDYYNPNKSLIKSKTVSGCIQSIFDLFKNLSGQRLSGLNLYADQAVSRLEELMGESTITLEKAYPDLCVVLHALYFASVTGNENRDAIRKACMNAGKILYLLWVRINGGQHPCFRAMHERAKKQRAGGSPLAYLINQQRWKAYYVQKDDDAKEERHFLASIAVEELMVLQESAIPEILSIAQQWFIIHVIAEYLGLTPLKTFVADVIKLQKLYDYKRRPFDLKKLWQRVSLSLVTHREISLEQRLLKQEMDVLVFKIKRTTVSSGPLMRLHWVDLKSIKELTLQDAIYVVKNFDSAFASLTNPSRYISLVHKAMGVIEDELRTRRTIHPGGVFQLFSAEKHYAYPDGFKQFESCMTLKKNQTAYTFALYCLDKVTKIASKKVAKFEPYEIDFIIRNFQYLYRDTKALNQLVFGEKNLSLGTALLPLASDAGPTLSIMEVIGDELDSRLKKLERRGTLKEVQQFKALFPNAAIKDNDKGFRARISTLETRLAPKKSVS